MRVRVPGPGQMAELERLWQRVTAADDAIRDALRAGSVPREDFVALWRAFEAARKEYEALGASFPEVDIPWQA